MAKSKDPGKEPVARGRTEGRGNTGEQAPATPAPEPVAAAPAPVASPAPEPAPEPVPTPTFDDITMPSRTDPVVMTQPIQVDAVAAEPDTVVATPPAEPALTVVDTAAPQTAQTQYAQKAEGSDGNLASAFDDSASQDEPAAATTTTTAPDEPAIITLKDGRQIDLKVIEAGINGDASAWNQVRQTLMGLEPMTAKEVEVFNTLDGVPLNMLLSIERQIQLAELQGPTAALRAVLGSRAADLQFEGALDLTAANYFKDGEALSEFYMAGGGIGLTDAQKAVVDLGGGAGVRDILGVERQSQLLGGDNIFAGMFGVEADSAGWITTELEERRVAINEEEAGLVMRALNGDAFAYAKLRALRGLETTQAQLDQYNLAGGVTAAEAYGFARQAQLLGVEWRDGSPIVAAVDARLNGIAYLARQALEGDTTALARLGAAIPGATLSPEYLGKIAGLSGGITSTTGPSATGSTSGTVPVNQADASLDRVPDPTNVAGPVAPTSTDATGTGSGTGSGGYTPVLPAPSEPSAPVEFTPDSTATNAANNLADWVDGIAGQVGASGSGGDGTVSGRGTGTTTGDQLGLTPRGEVEVGDQETGFGTTTRGTTDDGRSYTQTDMGSLGFKREYDDTGTVQFFNPDGTAKGGELHLHTDAGSTDGTNPYEGTTDETATSDDETATTDDEEDDDSTLDDGNSDTATAYVNPDADEITMTGFGSLSPVIAQIIATGHDPTTTTPSGPYVDDSPTPLPVLTGQVDLGLRVLQRPGIVNPNPEDTSLQVVNAMPPTIDPEGPDTVGPGDPTLGSGPEDVNPGDFTPPPSNALTGIVGDDAIGESLAAPADPTLATSQLDSGITAIRLNTVAPTGGTSLLGEGPDDDGFQPPG